MIEPDSDRAVSITDGDETMTEDREGPPGQSTEGSVSPEPALQDTPQEPTGLVGVFTQKSVVLTWNDPPGGPVKGYRVYRASDGDYLLVGETVTPAFTDRDVVPGRSYAYRVSAVGLKEGRPSQSIVVSTGVQGQ